MMLNEAKQQEKTEYIRGLRDMCDWLESREELPAPSGLIAWCWTAQSVAAFAELRRNAALTDKRYDGDHLEFYKNFGIHEAYIFANRSLVCTKRIVGERVVPARPKHIIEAVPEHAEPVYEWDCESVLEKAHEEENHA